MVENTAKSAPGQAGWMTATAIAFFTALVCAHAVGDPDSVLERPLSQFRDGHDGWLGYAMFFLLLLMGVQYTVVLVRSRMEAEAFISGLGVSLILIVSLTSSSGAFHLLTSLLLLLILFSFFGSLIRRAGNPCLWLHLTVPVLLVFATRFHSYGLWQKSLIVYFILAAVFHVHILQRNLQNPREARRDQPRKRRKVYQLEPGPVWQRRKQRGSNPA
jgi:hypothetical protein